MKPVLYSFAYSLEFLREQLADVAEPGLVIQPAGMVNHPAWTIGHLAFIYEQLGGVVGLPAWLPGHWINRFGSGSIPVPDPKAYETKDSLLSVLRDAQQRITSLVEQLDDSALDAPFPDETFSDVFPTIRHFLTQVLVAHTAFHVGQISVWRKLMGLKPMQRSFE